MRETIERLRRELPPLLTSEQYGKLLHRNLTTAKAVDFQTIPGLATKVGRKWLVSRERVLEMLADGGVK